MRGISVTALLISNLAYAVIFVLAIALVSVAAFIVGLFGDIDALPAMLEGLKLSEAFDLLTRCVSYTAAAVGAGFVAARMNREHRQLQSALALSGSTFVYFFGLGHMAAPHSGADLDAPAASTFATVYLFVGPLLGMLGGHLAERYEAHLDAMSPQERDAHTVTAIAIAVLRWILAFATAIAAFCMIVPFALGLPVLLGPLVIAVAVVVAILAGTLVAPPAHRKVAGFLFIGLTLFIPGAQIVGDVMSGEVTGAHALFILVDMVAAGFAYVGLRTAFPRPFATHPGRWWWILDLDLARWSPDERTVRRGLTVTASVIWFALAMVLWATTNGKALVLSTAVALPIALMAARPAFGRMAPDLLWRADQNAATRLDRHGAAPAE